MPGYEFRQEQLDLALAVAESLETGGVLLAEAGTGVGKSLGYLVPVILKCLREEKKAFIATGTKTLQHQLMEKELPFLKRHLGVEFSYALAIGAENYLCERRLASCGTGDQAELFNDATEVSRIKVWAPMATQGLRSEIGFQVSNQLWNQVCRIPELCSGQDCGRGGECFYQRSRRRLVGADVLVGNHHLLFANLRSDWEYLPDGHLLVIDEAHTLDVTASDCLGIEFSHRALRRVWEGLRGKDGAGCLLGSLLEVPLEQRMGMIDQVRRAEQKFHETLHWFHDQVLVGQPRVAVDHATAVQGVEHFIESLSEVVASLKQVARKIEREEARLECEGYATRLNRVLLEARAIVDLEPDAPWLLWAELFSSAVKNATETYSTAIFHATPVEPNALLAEQLYPHFESSVLVSATLATGGDFALVQQRLGTPKSRNVCLASPFDYHTNLLVFTPPGIPEPTQLESYVDTVGSVLVDLVDSVPGGALVLCTSYKMLNALEEEFSSKVSGATYREWAEKGSAARSPLVLCQGDASREKVLDAFRAAEKSVLFATSTFWQGIDLPGRALELVVITRLPFQVPDDPVLEAKIQRCRARGGNPFKEIQVPHAVMLFRQGMGRLIRTKTDRGVVAVLDPRILTKDYGRDFLAAIPTARTTRDIAEVKDFYRTFN